MKRYLGLDVGSRTVGVAVSDPLGLTAQGLEIIRINEDQEEFGLDRLGELIDSYQATKVVIGLPKNMNNSEGPRAEASRAYGDRVKQHFDLEVVYLDERLTTTQAERMLIEAGDVSRKKRKQVIDKLAAVLILQTYLDQERAWEIMASEENKELITIYDEEGNESLYEILFTFESDDFGKSYVLLYPAGLGDSDDIEIQAFSYQESDDELNGSLYPIESDEEWNMVEEVLNTFISDEL